MPTISTLPCCPDLDPVFFGDQMMACLTEAPDAIRFDRWLGIAPHFLAASSGIAFGPDEEVRWVRRPSGFHVVLLSDKDRALPGAAALPATRLTDPAQVLLWGVASPDPSVFLDARIPRPLTYPYPSSLPAVEGAGLALQLAIYEIPRPRPELGFGGVAWREARCQVERFAGWIRK